MIAQTLLSTRVRKPSKTRPEETRTVPLQAFTKGTLKRPEELAGVVAHCLPKGIGGEWKVEGRSATEWLSKTFRGVPSIGGTAAIAAKQLSHLSFETALYLPSRGELLTSLLGDQVLVPQNALLRPATAVSEDQPDPLHYVVQYKSGSSLEIAGTRYLAPTADRIIFTVDPAASQLQIEGDFTAWMDANVSSVDAAVICGYNLLDRSVYRNRIQAMTAAITRWKQTNPRLIEHVELSDTRALPNGVADILGLLTDRTSVGMNAQEFRELSEVLLGTQPSTKNLETAATLAARIAARLNVSKLVLHTQEWALGVCLSAPATMARDLALGCLTAAARYHYGAFADAERLAALHNELGLHETGARSCRDFGTERGRRHGGYYAVAVPTRLAGGEHWSVGLGDSFVAGLVAGYAVTAKQARARQRRSSSA